MKKSGFAKGVIWTLSIGIALVVILAVVGVVAYNGYTNAALEASYSKGNTETTIKIEKKDKISSEIASVDKKQVKFNKDLLKDKKKLNFKKHGPFYGIKENGMMIRGILKGFQNKGFKTDFYGLFTKNQLYWKGYSEIKYDDGRVLYQYNEYKLDQNGKVIIDKDGIYQLVDNYLISEEDFSKVRKYIAYDISIPFDLYDFEEIQLVKNKSIQKQIKFTDKKYLGQTNKDEQPHGQGTYVYSKGKNKGDKYEGEFVNGVREGVGTYIKINGDKYTGQWKQDKLDGYGIFEWFDGVKYEGQYKNGLQDGSGTYTFLNGNTYEGEWIKDVMDYGTMTYVKQGVTYKGYWKEQKWHGQGLYTFKSGETFEGQFSMGELDHGNYDHSNGDKFFGKYKNGKRYYGTFYYKSLGDEYKGYFKNDIRNGQGLYTYKNGDTHQGQWIDDKKHGQGLFTYKNGDTLQGNWENGYFNEGIATYVAGNIYTGQFKDGKKDGLGTLILANGKKLEGKFQEGEFIGDQKVVQNLTSNKIIKTDEKYYALVIGNNNYEYLEKLDAAENDAIVIADVLTNKYGFEVELLLNADYEKTVDTLFQITNKLKRNDNLLIYYAGHGELDKAENRGYWLPVDASFEQRSKWISNQRIVDRIKATKAKHVLLIADSCFSGTLMRSSVTLENNETLDEKNIERLKSKKTRLVITSGGNEPVVDSDGGDHSLFALKLIDTLKNNNTVINSQMLFENIRRYVISNADQTPERALVHKTGHDGGDFLFFPKE